jgi:hypothetical protein
MSAVWTWRQRMRRHRTQPRVPRPPPRPCPCRDQAHSHASILLLTTGLTGPDSGRGLCTLFHADACRHSQIRGSQPAGLAFLRKRCAASTHSVNDLPAMSSSCCLANTLHRHRPEGEIQVPRTLKVSSGNSGLTARCFVCANRYGLVNLVVLGFGVLCCRRCWQKRRCLLLIGQIAQMMVMR